LKPSIKRLLKAPLIAICLVFVSVAWLWFGQGGIAGLFRSDAERQSCLERIHRLAEENQALLDEVKLLRTDMKYLESVARRRLNLIGKDEVVFRFSREETQEKGRVSAADKDKNSKTAPERSAGNGGNR